MGVFLQALCGLQLYAGGPGLRFIENKDQWEEGIHFGARVPGGHMFVRPGGFCYYLVDEEKMEALHEQTHHRVSEATGELPSDEVIDGQFVRMDWLGAQQVEPVPYGRSAAYYNYFLGRDPSRWASKAYGYEGIIYRSVYEGIDLAIYSAGANLKYDFTVSAGADPSQIAGLYQGADDVRLDGNGNLYVKTVVGELIEKRPYAYQFINGVKTPVPCEFLLENNTLSFCFPEGYDTCEPLVIDPLLIFSTYSGSTADNWGSTATPGERGNLYSAGVADHVNYGGTFPATPGAFQTDYGGMYDVAVLKYDSTGSTLLYASYLGGDQSESPHSLVMAANEELLVLGTTSSENFPATAGAYDDEFNEGTAVTHVVTYNNGSDIFVARISADGSQLLASTYLGGSANDGLNPPAGPLTANYGDELRGDIITGEDGNIYISTVTASADFPVVNSFNTTFGGGQTDALLLKLSADLSQILWGAFAGGSGADAAHTLKIDSNGDILAAGGTTSADFPVTAGSYQDVHAGNADGWIARVAGDGSAILNATYTGTVAYDQVYFLDMNESEEIYIYGQTAGGTSFPITPGVYNNPNSGQFVQKFTNDLSALIFSTVFGSGGVIPDISPTAFLVNECNNLYMSGWGGIVNINTGHWNSDTQGMPLTPDAYQSATSGSDFYFMVLTDDASEFLYGTYLGGSASRTHVDGGTSRFDKGGIVYHAVCSGCAAYNALGQSTSDFPTTSGAWSRVNRSQNCNNAAFKFDLSSLRAGLQTNSIKLDMPGLKDVCLPDSILFQNRCTGGELFAWDFGDGTKLVTPDTAAIPHRYQNTGQYTVKLKAIDPGTCKVEDSTATVVNIYEKQGVVQGDDDLCEGSPYALWASGGVAYHWVSQDSTFQSTVATPAVSPEDTTLYIVRITEASGCVYFDSVRLNVIPGIDPAFEIVREGECIDRPAVHVSNTTEDAADVQMTFDFGDGTSSDLPETVHAYDRDDRYTIRLTGVREFCVYEKEVQMPIYKLKVPNVVTPGMPEGKNDTFIIQFGENEEATPADFGIGVSITIYNRWGAKVFETPDYQYNWAGQDLATGVYFYELTVEGQATCKGWVHLVK